MSESIPSKADAIITQFFGGKLPEDKRNILSFGADIKDNGLKTRYRDLLRSEALIWSYQERQSLKEGNSQTQIVQKIEELANSLRPLDYQGALSKILKVVGGTQEDLKSLTPKFIENEGGVNKLSIIVPFNGGSIKISEKNSDSSGEIVINTAGSKISQTFLMNDGVFTKIQKLFIKQEQGNDVFSQKNI